MQITDMLNQYNRNLANGIEVSGGTQGIKQVVSSLQGMSVGNIFEGSINHIENGVVTLGLSDGKTVQAKLDSGISVKVGDTMFFQVKSNNGSQIAIRPYSDGLMSNPTLLNALEAANLQANDKTLTMVNTMMEQAMSIDKQSLLNMAKLVMGNDGMDITSMVQMTKLGIPITEEMAAQFENYKSDQYAILNQLESVMEELPKQLTGGNLSYKELLDLNQQMVKVFLGEGQVANGENVQTIEQSQGQQMAESVQNGELTLAEKTLAEDSIQAKVVIQGDEILQTDSALKGNSIQQSSEVIQQSDSSQVNGMPQQSDSSKVSGMPQEVVSTEVGKGQSVIRNMFTGTELKQLFTQLGKIPELTQNQTLFQDGVWNTNISSKELLQLIGDAFSSKNPFTREALADLVSSKEYRALIRNVMEQQWLIKPEELKTEHKVSELYERLDKQLEQMEKVLKSFGQSTPQLSETATNVRSNIQFMNQINQTFAYVQIPLKLAGQNAHSDLYVYTDKKKMQEKDGELTAFLHLDLEHLGSTDVSVKLHQKKVTTNFYLADDASFDLLMAHMDVLEKRLQEKGYDAKIHVNHQEEKVNFVEELLKQNTPSAGGMVHRYSFDVRA